jgi:Arc/MetJ family transcription regulator
MLIRMPTPVKKAAERRPTRQGKVRKEFWLDPKTLRRAQRILGTATERETVEVALDMIAFRRELLDGAQALAGLQIDPIQ